MFLRAPFSVNVLTTGSQILGPNSRRRGLIISAPLANQVNFVFGDAPADLLSGIVMYAGVQPLVIAHEYFRDGLTEALQGIAKTAAQQISGYEFVEA